MEKETIDEESLRLHEERKGKIEMKSTFPLKDMHDLSLAYTPGVAASSREIAKVKEAAYRYTAKGNMVAVVSNGSAVLGLGNIGPEAALPVMEGKAILFKAFGSVDAFPIVIDSQDPEEIINTVKRIAPGFGGINLEDIKAPECFEIEERLDAELEIPIFHDDQHGTAIVVLAGLMNAMKVTGKAITEQKVLINGAGAAGTAIGSILLEIGITDIVILDSHGALYSCRNDIQLNKVKSGLAQKTNMKCTHQTKSYSPDCERCIQGGLARAIIGRDIFIGVSKGGILKKEMIKSMNPAPIIFALANPDPEILPQDAKDAGAQIVATGRSDFQNQMNNVLAFPGIFKGALRSRATQITMQMKIDAAKAIAESIEPSADRILPDVFEKGVADRVADAVSRHA